MVRPDVTALPAAPRGLTPALPSQHFDRETRPTMDITETRIIALSHGWDAANYADAYGGWPAPEEARLDTMTGPEAGEYRTYFDTGVELYRDGLFTDGTRMDPDEVLGDE